VTIRTARSVAAPLKTLTVALLIALAAPAVAQDAQPVPPPKDAATKDTTAQDKAVGLSNVVVTGAATKVSQLDAPFAITTIDRQQYDRAAPTSLVQAIRAVPGYWTESSGGQGGGQNIYVRGLPDGGWYNVQLQQDGLPIVDEPQESFLNIDTLNRTDLTTAGLEVVTGGTSPIYANNAAGGTVNLISRWGTTQPTGALRVTGGSDDLRRLEGYASGPITDKILYSVGGFARDDSGFRNAGYKGDSGSQLRTALSFLFDSGRLDWDARYLNDRTAFYTATPLRDPRHVSQSLSPALDPGDGTILSNSYRQRTLESFDGNGRMGRDSDLANGIHTKMFQTGTYLDLDLGDSGWTLSNKLRYTNAEVDYDTIFSGANPSDSQGYLDSRLAAASRAFPGTTRLGYVDDASGTDVAPVNGLVMESPWWAVRTRVRTVIDDLRLSRTLTTGWGDHDVAVGLYGDDFSFRQSRLSSTLLTTVQNQASALDVLAYNANGAPTGSVTSHGFSRYGSSAVAGDVTGRYLTAYAADTWHITPAFSLDVGVRKTRLLDSGSNDTTATRNLGDSTTLADDAVMGFTGARTTKAETRDALTWTLGASYKVLDDTELFARFTRSQRLPRLQNIYLLQNLPVTNIKQGEAGIRFGEDTLSFSSIAYWSSYNRVSFSGLVLDPSTQTIVSLPLVGKTRTYGLENSVNWRPSHVFGLAASLTAQDPETLSLSAPGGVDAAAYQGKQLPRIPKWMGSLTPTAYFSLGGVPMEWSVTVFHTASRYVDFANQTSLPGYTTYDSSLLAKLQPNLTLQLSGSNLTNSHGLTEGNPRTDTLAGQGTVEPIYARAIFGRLWQASVTYNW